MRTDSRLEGSVARKPKKAIQIGGKNGRILLMDDSFNPIPAVDHSSSIENEDAFSASTKSSELVRDRTSSIIGSNKARNFFETRSSSGQFSESDDDYWSSKMSRSQNSGTKPRLTRVETNSLSSLSSSTGHRAWVGSRSPTLSLSDHERSLTTYQTCDALRQASQNYFDPKNIYSHAPIYYIRPAFTKRVPTPKPKTFPDLNFNDFTLTTTTHSPSSSKSGERSKTEINETSNWVLLPATWGSTVQVVLDPLEDPVKSGQAKIAGFGHRIKLKRPLT